MTSWPFGKKRKLTKNKSIQREIPNFQNKFNIKLKRFLLKGAKKFTRSRLMVYVLNACWSAAAIDLLGKTAYTLALALLRICGKNFET
jgi:hypothetical protein